MITKINKIKKFGVFENFENNGAVPEFKKFNLIYGWNCSGKTMLSRVFRCLEKGEKHPDYASAEFELETPEKKKYDNNFSSTKPNIRVFNSDFIKENLQWDTEKIEPIFILGEENIKLRTKLKDEEKILAETKENFEKLQQKQKGIDKLTTDKARGITDFLSLGRNFDRDDLKKIIEKVKSNTSGYIFLGTDFDRYKARALSSEQKPIIKEITFNIKDLEIIKEKAEEKLHRQAASSKIEKLLKNPQINDWVETGKKLHEGKTVCEFCGNPLPIDLLPKLNEHFSKDYESLKNDIGTLLRELNDLINDLKINLILPPETAFYTDIQSDFKKAKPVLEKEICDFKNTISSLISNLGTKLKKPFDKLEVTQFVNNTKELKKALADFNTIISKNNKRTANFEEEKTAAIEKLKEHFAAEFEKEEKYSERQAQLKNEQTNIEKGIEMQESKISAIKVHLEEIAEGAEKINEYLKIFFEKDDIKIEATDDKKFKLVRRTETARNLSEGEKTAISFAYFAAKLEEQNNKIGDTIVYIDDPVSSLDSNHLFNIYSFIKNIFYEHKDSKHIKCMQLFISTHNIEFYNLVCDWFDSFKKESSSYYLIKRIKNSHHDESILTESDELIKKYKSEYVYLFSLINEFHNKPRDTFKYLYYLPNVLRRFVETYLSFKYLSHKSINGNINNLIPDTVYCERARKFMHYYSHSLTTNKLIKFPDLAECDAIVNIIIKSVEKDDPKHYNSLVEAVKIHN